MTAEPPTAAETPPGSPESPAPPAPPSPAEGAARAEPSQLPELALRVVLRCGLLGGGLGLLGLLSGEPLQAWVSFTYVCAALGPAALIEDVGLRPPVSAWRAALAFLLTLVVGSLALAGAYVQGIYLAARRADLELADAWARTGEVSASDLAPLLIIGLSLGMALAIRLGQSLRRAPAEPAARALAGAWGAALLTVAAAALALAWLEAGRLEAVVGILVVTVLGCLPLGAGLAAYYVGVERLVDHILRPWG
ncbi:MAG: hypothetical protein AB7N76_15580 [Planctomycetota bacterium]